MQETKTITITTCDVCGRKLEFEDKYIPDVDWLHYSFKNDKGEEEEGYRLYKINPDGSVYDYNIGVCGGIEYMYVFNGKIYCTDSVTQKKIEIDI